MKICPALKEDILQMVALSKQKRLDYEKAQPQFWKYKDGAEKIQAKWFDELLEKDSYILLVAKTYDEIIGFIIGNLIEAPEVYDPGGLTLMIDDFCVNHPKNWNEIGKKLIAEIKQIAITKNATQILVVCGTHDEPKCKLLKELDLNIASEWYVDKI